MTRGQKLLAAFARRHPYRWAFTMYFFGVGMTTLVLDSGLFDLLSYHPGWGYKWIWPAVFVVLFLPLRSRR